MTRELGAFKTSMLQDAERGRPIELDALVTAVRELGQRTGVATPYIDALLGLTRLFAQSRGLYPATTGSSLLAAQDGSLIGLLDQYGQPLVGLEAVGRHGPARFRARP